MRIINIIYIWCIHLNNEYIYTTCIECQKLFIILVSEQNKTKPKVNVCDCNGQLEALLVRNRRPRIEGFEEHLSSDGRRRREHHFIDEILHAIANQVQRINNAKINKT